MNSDRKYLLVTEAERLKHEMEGKIKSAILDFSGKTGLDVTAVNLEMIGGFSKKEINQKIHIGHLSCTVELK